MQKCQEQDARSPEIRRHGDLRSKNVRAREESPFSGLIHPNCCSYERICTAKVASAIEKCSDSQPFSTCILCPTLFECFVDFRLRKGGIGPEPDFLAQFLLPLDLRQQEIVNEKSPCGSLSRNSAVKRTCLPKKIDVLPYLAGNAGAPVLAVAVRSEKLCILRRGDLVHSMVRQRFDYQEQRREQRWRD